MREFENKRKVRKVLSSPAVLIPLAVILLFILRGVWDIYLKDRQSAAELYSSRERLAKLQSRQETLSAASRKLSTESGIESEIRDRFGMAKEGEREIVIVENPSDQKPPPVAARNFLQKIVDFFTIR